MNRPIVLLLSGLALSASLAASRVEGGTPGTGGFELHPALEAHLYAGEPQVVDPVALTFDDQGRCYVLEMRDYPLGFGPDHRPGGTIRLLEDTDLDGRADRSVVFAEGLSFPTSITAWNGGVLVTAPPEILFLKDTDGDGRADVREVVLGGFRLGVTDSNMSGLRWGLDNRIHAVNGGNGGHVVSPRRKTAPPVDIRDSDFSFDPASGRLWRTFPTSGGFGLVFDDWGHRFCTHNINHLQQQILATRYLEHAAGLFPVDGTVSISDHGEMARIYPVSVAQTRVNHPEQAGHFSSSGGMGFLAVPGYPGDLPGSLFVCDVVGNLVHRDVLVEDGPVFQARRAPGEQTREFFASHDNACRPIGVECGPDGALYLIDIQRDVIEHPDYIPEKVKAKLDLRAGSDRGRIYRITPRGGIPARKVALGSLSHRDLVKQLAHSNGWWRATAQRLLIERHAVDAEDGLRALVQQESPAGALAALHAAWTLQGLGRIREADVIRLLRSATPGLRENALLISEELASPGRPVRDAILSSLRDPSPRVRFQAALTLGLRGAQEPTAQAALLALWRQDLGWRWSRVAVLAALGPSAPAFLEQTLAGREFLAARPGVEDSFRELAYVAARQTPTAETAPIARVIRILSPSQVPGGVRVATLNGLNEGLAADPKPWRATPELAVALEEASAPEDPLLRKACWQLGRRLGVPAGERQRRALALAASQAVDPAVPLPVRRQQVSLLELGDATETRSVLLRLVDSREPAELQREALRVLRADSAPEVAAGLLQRWRSLSPSLRPEVADGLSSRRPWHGPLLDALEQGVIKPGELNLDLEQRRHLLRHSTPENRGRAARFFGDEEYSNRRKLIEDWLPRVPQAGDVARGREVFVKLCTPCHQSGDLGNAVGPNLSDLSHRSVEDLVSNILDPNMAVNPAFATVSCETRDGELVLGVLDSENADTVVLRQAGGVRRTLPRSTLTRVEFTSTSLMPEGLEASLSPQELRDVVAFLQGHP